MRPAARDFPPGTPLHHFFAWNEAVAWWRRDRRYQLAAETRTLAEAGCPGAAGRDRQRPIWRRMRRCSRLSRRRRGAGGEGRRRILVIRLSALGDFIQALGPIAAIRRHHAGDHVSLLTTRPLAGFAEELGCFDEVIVDERPGVLAPRGWLRLRRRLRAGRFDRVYDLQTSHRSAAYAWLLRPGMPEWSGIAWRCSHPHANLRPRRAAHARQAGRAAFDGRDLSDPAAGAAAARPARCRIDCGTGISCCWFRGRRLPIPKSAGRPNASARWRGRSTRPAIAP